MFSQLDFIQSKEIAFKIEFLIILYEMGFKKSCTVFFSVFITLIYSLMIYIKVEAEVTIIACDSKRTNNEAISVSLVFDTENKSLTLLSKNNAFA